MPIPLLIAAQDNYYAKIVSTVRSYDCVRKEIDSRTSIVDEISRCDEPHRTVGVRHRVNSWIYCQHHFDCLGQSFGPVPRQLVVPRWAMKPLQRAHHRGTPFGVKLAWNSAFLVFPTKYLQIGFRDC